MRLKRQFWQPYYELQLRWANRVTQSSHHHSYEQKSTIHSHIHVLRHSQAPILHPVRQAFIQTTDRLKRIWSHLLSHDPCEKDHAFYSKPHFFFLPMCFLYDTCIHYHTSSKSIIPLYSSCGTFCFFHMLHDTHTHTVCEREREREKSSCTMGFCCGLDIKQRGKVSQ